MKAAFLSLGNDIDAPLAPEFGEAKYFLIFDTENPLDYKIVVNPYLKDSNSSSILSAQMLVNMGVKRIIAKCTNVNVLRIFNASGVELIQNSAATYRTSIHFFNHKNK